MKRKFVRCQISNQLYFEGFNTTLQWIFKDYIPTKVDYNCERDRFDITLYSESFPEIEEGNEIPLVDFSFTAKDGEIVSCVINYP